MSDKLRISFCCIVILLAVVLGGFSVIAERNAANETKALIDDILDGMIKKAGADSPQEWLNGELADGAGGGSEWFVFALRQYDPSLDFTGYADALEAYLSEHRVSSASSRQRCALALVACGRKNAEFVSLTLEDSIGNQGIMSLIYGLHLLNNGLSSKVYTKEALTGEILSARLSDGGWAVTGETSDIDVTAMAVQALAPQYNESTEVKSAVDAALLLLSAKQLDGGGFQSYGKDNPESAAQVITALSSLGTDPTQTAGFLKNGRSPLDAMLSFRLSDGSFSHMKGDAEESSYPATQQAFYSLVSLYLCQTDSGYLYIFRETSDESDCTGIDLSGSESRESASSAGSAGGSAVKRSHDIKSILYIGIAAVGILACIILFVRGKRKPGYYLSVAAAVAVALVLVFFADIKSAGEYYGNSESKENPVGSVVMTIRCDTVLGKSDSEYIPSNGIVLPETEFLITEKNTVFDVLTEAARKYTVQMEYEGSASTGLVYVTGINYLYEFDFGDLSGWIFLVNGEQPSVGCGEYRLSDGDVVEWVYTCNLGEDVKRNR